MMRRRLADGWYRPHCRCVAEGRRAARMTFLWRMLWFLFIVVGWFAGAGSGDTAVKLLVFCLGSFCAGAGGVGTVACNLSGIF
jgi:hypothetical protein